MNVININVTYLQNLASRMRQVESDLRHFSALGTEVLSSSPTVESAYRDLSSRWDQRRNELADALSSFAGGVDTAVQSFVQTDSDLANALTAPAECTP